MANNEDHYLFSCWYPQVVVSIMAHKNSGSHSSLYIRKTYNGQYQLLTTVTPYDCPINSTNSPDTN